MESMNLEQARHWCSHGPASLRVTAQDVLYYENEEDLCGSSNGRLECLS